MEICKSTVPKSSVELISIASEQSIFNSKLIIETIYCFFKLDFMKFGTFLNQVILLHIPGIFWNIEQSTWYFLKKKLHF